MMVIEEGEGPGERFDWRSAAGRAVRKRLEAWGARERERHASAEGGALPSVTETLPGGGRGKPGDLPAVFHAAIDVDLTLQEWPGSPKLRELLLFVYRDGVEWYQPRGESVWRLRYVYDLDEFVDEDLDRAIRLYYPLGRQGARFFRYRRRFLARSLVDFAEFMVRKRGLGTAFDPERDEEFRKSLEQFRLQKCRRMYTEIDAPAAPSVETGEGLPAFVPDGIPH